MKPIPFLPLDDKVTRCKILGVRLVFTSLGDNIDEQVPGSRLAGLCQRARDRLLGFVRGSDSSRHRCGGDRGQPGNVGSGQRGTMPRGGARGLLNDGLPCGEGVLLRN